jgi:hypothetical protein
MSLQEDVIRWFYRLDQTDSGKDFNGLLLSCLSTVGNKDITTAQAIVTRRGRHFWDALKLNSEADLQRNRHAPIYCVDDLLYHYHLPADKVRLDGSGDKARLLEARPHILKGLDQINDREYEAAACEIMALIGAIEVHLTPDGNEGGVDFYALIDGDTGSHLFGKSSRGFRIVGQTKKYEQRESITHFNSFLKVLDNVRHLHGSVAKCMPDWFRRKSGPIVGLYIAHSGYQSGVFSAAAEHGVVLADSIDLAEMCALSTKLDPSALPNRRAELFLEQARQLLIV